MERLNTPGPTSASSSAAESMGDVPRRSTSTRASKRSPSPQTKGAQMHVRADVQVVASTSAAATSGSVEGHPSWLHRTSHNQQSHARRTSLTPANNDQPYSPVVGSGKAAASPAPGHVRGVSAQAVESWAEWARGPLRLTGKGRPRTSLWDSLRRVPDLIWVELQNPIQKPANSDVDSGQDDRISLTSRPRRRKGQSSSHNILKVVDKARKPLGITRSAFILLLTLLFVGLYELQSAGVLPSQSVIPPANDGSLHLDTRDPFATLQQAGIPVSQLRKRQNAEPLSGSSSPLAVSTATTSGTAAILLNWKRLDHLLTVVSHLCLHAGGVFDAVHIWNNNPDVLLTQHTFAAAQCPPHALRIYNSPANWLFASRYMACAETESAYCYFQDDDWLVPSLPAVHAHFMRDPHGPLTVATGDEFAVKEGWEWCFFNSGFDLNTCFAWLGTGAFVSRKRVLATLDAITRLNPDPRDKTGSGPPPVGAVSASLFSMLDNGFATLQNEPPYVIAGKLHPLPQPAESAFTAGSHDGDERNELFIQQSLTLLTSALSVPPDTSGTTVSRAPGMLRATHSSIADLPGPHPYKHYSRAVSDDNEAIFMTNIPILPPPGSIVYQPSLARNLSVWEARLSDGEYSWSAGKDWALQFPYIAAVDGDLTTAFRSAEPVQPGDFVGLDMLSQIDVDVRPTVSLRLHGEESEILGPALRIEVSDDGKRWQAPSQSAQLSCQTTNHYDQRPSSPFPRTYLTSTQAQLVIDAASSPQSGAKQGWSAAQKRLQLCSADVATSMGGSRRKGWRFVRIIADAGHSSLGWAVYEIKIV